MPSPDRGRGGGVEYWCIHRGGEERKTSDPGDNRKWGDGLSSRWEKKKRALNSNEKKGGKSTAFFSLDGKRKMNDIFNLGEERGGGKRGCEVEASQRSLQKKKKRGDEKHPPRMKKKGEIGAGHSYYYAAAMRKKGGRVSPTKITKREKQKPHLLVENNRRSPRRKRRAMILYS